MQAQGPPLFLRLLVLDIVIFPLTLFVGITVFLAWKLLEYPYIYPFFVVATALNVLVGIVQTRMVLNSLKDW